MKKSILNKICVICALGGLTYLGACSDRDDHFMSDSEIMPTAQFTIWENLKSDSRFTQFCALVEKVGYQDLLQTDKAYTVWAPVNNAPNFPYDSLMNLDDKKIINEFVQNHIALYSFSVPFVDKFRKVKILNNKFKRFVYSDSLNVATFASQIIEQGNIPCRNGFIHVLQTRVPYYASIYELLNTDFYPIDSVANYYHSFDTRTLNTALSTIGPLKNGERSYLDSVFDESNALWNRYNARINVEDSNYTMLVPTNIAWEKAKLMISKYYNYIPTIKYLTNTAANEASGREERQQRINTAYLQDSLVKVYLMQNLFYNNNLYYNPKLDSLEAGQLLALEDTAFLYTTRGTRTYGKDAINLFSNVIRHNCSNGVMFITDSIRMQPWNWCCPVVRLEAENTGRSYHNADDCRSRYVRFGEQNPAVTGVLSNNGYLEVGSSSTSSNAEIDFLISNIRSTEYYVYSVFVPSNITNERDSLPLRNRVRVVLGLNNANGDIIEQARTDNEKEGLPAYLEVETDPSKIDTIFIGKFNFPICYTGTNARPYVRLMDRVTRRDDATVWSHTFLIDCMLFVPKELAEYIRKHPEEEEIYDLYGLSKYLPEE